MKTFYITSTISVESESLEELDKIISENGSDQQMEMMWDLWNNAEVDEAPNEHDPRTCENSVPCIDCEKLK